MKTHIFSRFSYQIYLFWFVYVCACFCLYDDRTIKILTKRNLRVAIEHQI